MHNYNIEESIRKDNKLYNESFIKSLKIKDVEIFETYKSKYKALLNDNNPFQTVWFKNIDRLMVSIEDLINIKDYHLLDVGSGLGFSTIYFKEKFKFKTYQGFDYDSYLVKKSQRIADQIYKNNTIKFFHADAADFYLEDNKSYVLFIFNSFGKKTMKKFLSNNLKNLKKNKGIILYCNDHHYTEINSYESFCRDDFYNLSTFFF